MKIEAISTNLNKMIENFKDNFRSVENRFCDALFDNMFQRAY